MTHPAFLIELYTNIYKPRPSLLKNHFLLNMFDTMRKFGKLSFFKRLKGFKIKNDKRTVKLSLHNKRDLYCQYIFILLIKCKAELARLVQGLITVNQFLVYLL